jgi:PAS domain S-box-containing protein
MTKKKADDKAFPRRTASSLRPATPPAANDTLFGQLAALVRERTGMDVAPDREATLLRRVERHRRMLGLGSDEAYLAHLQQHPEAVQALQRSFLMSVTSFFRDATAFAALRSTLLALLQEKPADEPLRAWVPGCATGEAAVSVGIALLDALADGPPRADIKVFATDLDAEAIAIAQRGRYETAALEGLDPALRARHFVHRGDAWEVSPAVRTLCVFAQHDVVHDTPFSRVDLIACRHLLLHLRPPLQDAILQRFHQALRPNGLLLLGPAESLSDGAAPLFDTIDPEQRLFRRKPGPAVLHPVQPPRASVTLTGEARRSHRRPRPAADASPLLREAMQQALLARHAPPSVLLDAATLTPLQFHGSLERYLGLTAGDGSFALPALLGGALRAEFQTLLARLDTPACHEAAGQPLLLVEGQEQHRVRLLLRRLPSADPPAPLLLSFEALPPAVPATEGSASTQALQQLGDELHASRQQSQALLQALAEANQALRDGNDELQASGEELETSNEELQAANEELSAVNDELQSKTADLAQLNDTLVSIQDSIQSALLVVDRQRRLLRYNAQAARVLGLLPADLGRDLAELPLLGLPGLVEQLTTVMELGRPRLERASRDQRHHLVQIAPYRNPQGEPAGAVLSFADVSELHAADAARQQLEDRFRRITQALTEVVWMSAPAAADAGADQPGGLRPFELLYLSPSFEALWGSPVAQALADPELLLDAVPMPARDLLRRHLQNDDAGPWTLEVPLTRPDGSQRWARVQGRSVQGDDGRRRYQVCSATDLTDRVRAEQAVRDSERQFRLMAHSLPGLVWTCDANGLCDFVSEQWQHYAGPDAVSPLDQGWAALVHPQDQLAVTTHWQESVRHGTPYQLEFRLRRHDGAYRWFESRALPMRDEQGRIVRWFGNNTDIEDRKQSEERLQRNAELLQLMIDAVPTMLAYVDDRGICRWANRSCVNWLSRPPAEIVGHSGAELLGPQAHGALQPLMQRALAGETVTADWHGPPPAGGAERWLLLRFTPDRAPNGQVRGVIGTGRDITAERDSTQALQASEARANQIIESAPQAILVVDKSGRIERVNRHAEVLFRRPAEQLRATPLAQLIDVPAEGLGGSDRHTGTGINSHTTRAWRHDGSHFPVELGWAALEIDGRPATIFTVLDITMQVQAQRVLTEHQGELERQVHERTTAAQQAEAQLRLILESTADGLYGVDASGHITFVNAAACTLLGYTAAELLGRPASVLLPPPLLDGQAVPEDDAPLAQTLRTGAPSHSDLALLRHRSGRTIPARCSIRAMWRSGSIIGAVVGFSDATERLASEGARNAALAEAERLARMRTEFLTNMSHEIRTPLNAVLGLAEVAARGDRDRPPEQTFRMILDAGQVLLGVVNDILDFSKIEAGKLKTDSQPFELGPVIDRAVSLVAPRAFARGLQFVVDEAPDLPHRLRGDALRLTQVLGNLLSNALKFTEAGGIELRVWCDEHDLWFTVHDSGIGIEATALERLFKPFEQADSSTTRRFGGTGLGLVISRHLMELMNGSISVRSEPGAGSTFTVRLPLVDAQAAPPSPYRGTVVLAAIGEFDHVHDALRAQQIDVRSAPALQAFAKPVSLVVLGIDTLRDEVVRDAAIAARAHGQRIALLTHPLAAELPPALRGEVALLEQPVRWRHIASCLTDVATPEAEPHDDGGGRLDGLRVLAAEDNEVNGLVLEAIMRMEGAQLTLVENGRLAVEQLQRSGNRAFDLVLTDIQMPEMDGYAATRALLAIDPTLPVIGLTAHAMPEERERCLAAGMVDHLAKPIEVELLVTLVLRHARKRAH